MIAKKHSEKTGCFCKPKKQIFQEKTFARKMFFVRSFFPYAKNDERR